jgi:hypothetical protein
MVHVHDDPFHSNMAHRTFSNERYSERWAIRGDPNGWSQYHLTENGKIYEAILEALFTLRHLIMKSKYSTG